MYGQWIAFEHERLHIVEQWPENPAKEATLAAIASTIAMLRPKALDNEFPTCYLCLAKRIRVLSMTANETGRVPTLSSRAA